MLHDVLGCRDDPKDATRGEANLGGYCNKEVDALTDKVLVEADTAKRDQLIKQAYDFVIKDYGYIPLHQQSLAWGVSKKVKLAQRADNQVLLYWATKQESKCSSHRVPVASSPGASRFRPRNAARRV